MRKRIYTRNVGILLTEDVYQELIDTTDKLEVTISTYVRDLLVENLKKIEKEI